MFKAAGQAKWGPPLFPHALTMGVITWVQHLFHGQRARKTGRDITSPLEYPSSGWDRQSMRRCWVFLDQGNPSLAAVIKDLDGDLARTICLFSLVLRALNIIYGDVTLPDLIKQHLLRLFEAHTVTPGWDFSACAGTGSHENDRQLLAEYSVVVEELRLISPLYLTIILDIVEKMGTGMADYTSSGPPTDTQSLVQTIPEYDLYCHYTAGLASEGLSRLFSASRHEPPWLGTQIVLSNSMGLFLQKANLIRDFRKDVDAGRCFWPRELWGSSGSKRVEDLCEPALRVRATWAQSAMIVDALRHAVDALEYLRLLSNQNTFNFCAMPSAMALASLHACFMNSSMFESDGHLRVKVRNPERARVTMRATTLSEVAHLFADYARKIHAKAVPVDPNYLRMSMACAKIQQWQEHNYPSGPRSPSNVPRTPRLEPCSSLQDVSKIGSETIRVKAWDIHDSPSVVTLMSFGGGKVDDHFYVGNPLF